MCEWLLPEIFNLYTTLGLVVLIIFAIRYGYMAKEYHQFSVALVIKGNSNKYL